MFTGTNIHTHNVHLLNKAYMQYQMCSWTNVSIFFTTFAMHLPTEKALALRINIRTSRQKMDRVIRHLQECRWNQHSFGIGRWRHFLEKNLVDVVKWGRRRRSWCSTPEPSRTPSDQPSQIPRRLNRVLVILAALPRETL